MINTLQIENCVRDGELGKSCYSGVTVAHSSGSERSVVQVPVVAVCFFLCVFFQA